MEMGLYLVLLAILSTFLILVMVEKVRYAFNKNMKKGHFDTNARPLAPNLARK